MKNRISAFANVEIEKIVGLGNCLAHTSEGPLFIEHAAPGDIADIRVVQYKKKVYYGKIATLHTASPMRTEPVCEHAGICGGCKWQHIPYTAQLDFKNKEVIDQISRVAKQEDFEINPILGCEEQFEYRNKVELTFSETEYTPIHTDKGENALGFHVPGRFDWVVDINNCHLTPPLVTQIQRFVKAQALHLEIPFYNLKTKQGNIRTLLIRRNLAGEYMVLVSFARNVPEVNNALLEAIKNQFPQIASLLYTINNKANDTLEGLEILSYNGPLFITEQLENLKYRIQAQSFFQTNTNQALKLYQLVRNLAQIKPTDTVYDLYTGTGSIALFLAHLAAKVVGIEYVQAAVDDALQNASDNNINNCQFFAGDMAKVLTAEFMQKNGQPQIIITDPPRSGMHDAVIQRIIESEAQRIVYVSCNPGTQARDIQLLAEAYKLISVHPVDMFPHTHHIENIAVLERI